MCTGEAHLKLRKWGIPQGDADDIVNTLVRHRFIDDTRFAGAFARDRFMFGNWGRIKIAMQLRSKGIDGDIIRDAIDSIDSKLYDERLHEMMKHEAWRRADLLGEFGERQKLVRRFAGRGFEPSLVIATLKKILAEMKNQKP